MVDLNNLPSSKQKLAVTNESEQTIEVMAEMIPNRYLLKPKDELILVADVEGAPRNEGFSVNVYDGGLQIYAAWDIEPEAYINGEAAKADWVTPAPSKLDQ
jgi:hypothetical protein